MIESWSWIIGGSEIFVRKFRSLTQSRTKTNVFAGFFWNFDNFEMPKKAMRGHETGLIRLNQHHVSYTGKFYETIGSSGLLIIKISHKS